MSSLLRRLCASVTLGMCMAPAAFLFAVPAAQADTYRYWSYWHATDSSWALATEGSGNHVPEGGSVEGWRFVKSGAGGGQAPKPRPKPSFESICAQTSSKEGSKRVAVVIDYGTEKAAPRGARPPVKRAECARVPKDANGNEVLAAVAAERYGESGIVCSVDGYPQGACGGGSGSGGQADESQEQENASGNSGSAQAGSDSGGSGNSEANQSGANAANDQAASSNSESTGGGFPVGAVAGVAIGGLLIGGLGGAAVLRTRKAR